MQVTRNGRIAVAVLGAATLLGGILVFWDVVTPANERSAPVNTGWKFTAPGGKSLASLREALLAEAIDPTWAPSTEAQIQRLLDAKLEAEGIGAFSQEVECRSQTCRVKTVFSSAPENVNALMQLGRPVTEAVQEIVRDKSVATGAIIVYSAERDNEPASTEAFITRSAYNNVISTLRAPKSWLATLK